MAVVREATIMKISRLRPDNVLQIASRYSQDQTSSRTNTLFDDADDIQRQLDNEARDRIKFGRGNMAKQSNEEDTTVDKIKINYAPEKDWNYSAPEKDWNYSGQASWAKEFPDCGGRSQSPVDLPVDGLIKPRGGRRLMFQNNDVPAKSMTLMKDGKRMVLFGEWKNEQRPLIYGGAAHSRRYLFHSLAVHLPAEHTVGTLYYPLETQAYYVSAEYEDMAQALKTAPSDPLSILAVASLYSYGNHTYKGLKDILDAAKNQGLENGTIQSHCLNYFNPPFKEYACYQGSMTTPPCTESVLWLIRGRTLSIKRETWEKAKSMMNENAEAKQSNFRVTQPLNDRKVFYFKGVQRLKYWPGYF